MSKSKFQSANKNKFTGVGQLGDVDKHAVKSSSPVRYDRRPGGRPPKPEAEKMQPLGIHLPLAVLSQLANIARERGVPLATCARLLITERLKQIIND